MYSSTELQRRRVCKDCRQGQWRTRGWCYRCSGTPMRVRLIQIWTPGTYFGSVGFSLWCPQYCLGEIHIRLAPPVINFCVRAWQGHVSSIECTCSEVIVGYEDGCICLWNMKIGNLTQTICNDEEHQGRRVLDMRFKDPTLFVSFEDSSVWRDKACSSTTTECRHLCRLIINDWVRCWRVLGGLNNFSSIHFILCESSHAAIYHFHGNPKTATCFFFYCQRWKNVFSALC